MGMGVWQESTLACLDDCLGSDKGLSGVQEPQQPLNDAIHILHLCVCLHSVVSKTAHCIIIDDLQFKPYFPGNIRTATPAIYQATG